ncbi:MAG: DEAD/DEAH box helicase [Acidobacteria bacterium]|nr:DEAD/DEAH box helicase [Acidobacteriota bacterium]
MLSPVAPALDTLREAVRRAAGPQAWSRGVELCRRGAVQFEARSDEEITARVATRGGLISPLVTLFPADPAWSCECDSRAEACEHVAAVLIALGEADAADPTSAAEPAGRGLVGYRLRRAPGGPALGRVVVTGCGAARTELPLEVSLVAIATGRVDGPAFMATPADLACEQALGTFRGGAVPRELWPRLLLALSRCRDVTLDGAPVAVSVEQITPVVRLQDHGMGFRLQLAPDPRVSERLAPGVVLCGDRLHPFAEAALNARERENLAHGLAVPPERAGWLVSELLPSLAGRLPLLIETTRLPKSGRSAPRARVETRRDGDALVVLARIVYGDPPVAHVEGERLLVNGSPVPVRDESAERRLARELETALGVRSGAELRLEPREGIAFAERLRAWAGAAGGAGTLSLGGDAHESFTLAPPLVPRARLDPQRFAIDFVGPVAGPDGRIVSRQADAERVIAAWRDGEPLVPLLEGGFAPLPADWLERHGALVADLLAARDARGGLARSAFPALARLAEQLGEPAPPALDALAPLYAPDRAIPPARLPADLAATLRGYQRAGVDWLAFLRDAGLGALLADDMGLGKTLQALAALSGRALVVCPASVVHNWLAEARRFRPLLRVAAYHGAGRVLPPDAELLVTTYAILRLDADRLAAERWDAVVLDEAQAIKNPESQTARAAFRLSAPFRLAMTGTPVENRLEELWSLLRFANPGLLGRLDGFLERHARPIAAGVPGAAERLRATLRPFVLRRLKRDVAPELPPRTEVALYCALEPEERAAYDAVLAATRDEVVAKLRSGGGTMEALEALLRLRQAACHRGLLPGQSADSSSKVELLLETLETALAEGHKALVFSQWTALLDLLEPPLARAGIAPLRLDGATRDREGVVRAFQSEGGPPVMLVSLKAGGTGINLTAADHVVLFDPWWNPAAEDQAADRAHRIGQDRPVLVTRLVAEATVEERILALQQRKRALAEAALGGDAAAASAGGLSRDDLLELLGG